MISFRREKISQTIHFKTYRRLWKQFDYGLITKNELVAKLNQIQNGEGEMLNVK